MSRLALLNRNGDPTAEESPDAEEADLRWRLAILRAPKVHAEMTGRLSQMLQPLKPSSLDAARNDFETSSMLNQTFCGGKSWRKSSRKRGGRGGARLHSTFVC